ncbi:MAG: glycosyltransferase [Spirochaetes bacterium]|nr:glycosyltransferase [Spirochaetota bacterium]
MKITGKKRSDQYGSYRVMLRSDMIKDPPVSVVMSVYNGGLYLKEALDSITGQSYKEFEFIIVNDGSTDNSFDLLYDYLKKDKRILIMDQENMGLTRSLNRAMSLARGKFIARQDADDVSLKDRLKKEYDFLSQNPDYGLVGSRFKVIGKNGEIQDPDLRYFVVTDKEIRKIIARFNPFCHTSVMFRREILHRVGYYDDSLSYSQDYLLWFRIMKKYKVTNLDDVLACRRYTKEMLSRKHDKKQIFYIIKTQLRILREQKKISFTDLSFILKNVFKLLIPERMLALLRSN